MEYLPRLIRAILICAFMSAALPNAHASAALTSKQVETLETKAQEGDKAALKKLMAHARKGNKYAQYALGGLYFTGQQLDEGPLRDFYKGEYWIRKAARQGLSDAQSDMGVIYHDDVGFSPVPAKSAYWHRRAADQGNSRSRFIFAGYYANGYGVPENNVVAYALYGDEPEPSKDSCRPIKYCAELAADMTAQEIKAAQALAQELNRPGNFRKALNRYLAASAGKKH